MERCRLTLSLPQSLLPEVPLKPRECRQLQIFWV